MKVSLAFALLMVAQWCAFATAGRGQVSTTPAGTTPASTTQRYEQQLDDARALESTAYTTNSKADFARAAAALEACSKLDPTDLSLDQSLGYLYLDKLDLADLAIPHLRKVFAHDPEAASWGTMLAKALGEAGQTIDQINVLNKVIAFSPDDPWCRYELAKAWIVKKDLPRARAAFKSALQLSPDDKWLNVEYARCLLGSHDDDAALDRTSKVLSGDPNYLAARALQGDIYRDLRDLSQARAEYDRAMLIDPSYYPAQSGIAEIKRSTEPIFNSSYYVFTGSDHFNQAGLYNSLSVPITGKLNLSETFNTLWFDNDRTNFGQVVRYEQAVGLEFNPDRHFTFQAGASGFETDKQQDKAGFNFGATWKPDDRFYLFGYYRFNDPVNDSIATTYYGFTQRSLGVGAGYQASEDLALSIKASRAWYSDGNDRDFAHAEFAYTVFNPAQLKLGLEYELLDYRERASLYSSSSWYQTAGPVLQAEPPIAKWMSLAARVEGTYVVQASKMGITVTIGPNFHLGDRLECGAAYLLSSVPGSYSSYSGQGVKVNLSYRF